MGEDSPRELRQHVGEVVHRTHVHELTAREDGVRDRRALRAGVRASKEEGKRSRVGQLESIRIVRDFEHIGATDAFERPCKPSDLIIQSPGKSRAGSGP
jgi:hypothetical protein